jgi:hypothetical protein
MSALQEQRAARMGYTTAAPTRKPAAAAPTSRAVAEKNVYGNPYDVATANYYERRRASLRDDAERLQQSRAEEQQVTQFARKHGMSPGDTHTLLSLVREHELSPRGREVVAQRLLQTAEALRKEHGTEQAQKTFARYSHFATALKAEVPTLFDRAEQAGLGGHVDLIRIGAQYAQPVSTLKE